MCCAVAGCIGLLLLQAAAGYSRCPHQQCTAVRLSAVEPEQWH